MLIRSSRTGFSLIEILVVIMICAVLASLLVVLHGRSVEAAKLATCGQNLRDVYALMTLYLHDNEQVYPHAALEIRDEDGNLVKRTFWGEALSTYVPGTGRRPHPQFVCPAVKDPNPGLLGTPGNSFGSIFAYVTYGLNRYGISPGISDNRLPAVAPMVENPGEVMLAIDYESKSQPWEGWYYVSRGEMNSGWEFMLTRHSGKINVLYCNGRVRTMSRKEELMGGSNTDIPWVEKRYTRVP